MADHYLDALLAEAQTLRPQLPSLVKQFEERVKVLVEEDRGSLVRNFVQAVVATVDQALEGTLARRGQLVALPAPARQSLQALDLTGR